jgi:hypothetical protein
MLAAGTLAAAAVLGLILIGARHWLPKKAVTFDPPPQNTF